MKIFVTGGAGFIGSHFVCMLLAAESGFEVTVYDALTYAGNLENLREWQGNPNFRFVRGTITELSAVQRAMEGAAAVVNFAAESHVDRSLLDPFRCVDTNVVGTQTLLTAAMQAGVGRFLQVSTDEVYGDWEGGGHATEVSPVTPSSPYSAAKAGADHLVQAFARSYGLNAVITRGSNTFGSHQFPEKLIPLFITRALAGEPLPLYGDGGQVRDWLFVEDHCQGILTALLHGLPGEVYNVGGGNEWTNLDLARWLLKLVNRPQELLTFVKDRPGHDRRYAIDSTKLKALGWAPKRPFAWNLAETVRWYEQNLGWVGRVISGEYQSYYRTQYGER